MTIIIFIVILAILILSHEFGHFIVAKKSGIRVDEFGLGFPPRLFGWKKGETDYSLNIIPFGGFVKIFGENPDEESLTGPDRARSLTAKPKWIQALVLGAGVTANLILAWLVISLGLMIGLPTSASEATTYAVHSAPKMLIVSTLTDSPAAKAGLQSGDEIVSLTEGKTVLQNDLTVEKIQKFIAARAQQTVNLSYRRGPVFSDPNLPIKTVNLKPETGVIGTTAGVGISMDQIAIARASFFRALWDGLKLTINLTYLTAQAIFHFVAQAFQGKGDFSSVSGPVGLVGLAGNARVMGFVYLLSFMALISINLAVINLIPFPALDGGRLLFLLIEKIKGSAINPKIANTVNLVGFVLLLLLMAIVTYSDIAKLFFK